VELYHQIIREKRCSFHLTEDTQCGKPFSGTPHMRYCPECSKENRARHKRKWQRVAEHRAKQEGRK
jgi:rubredoxin